MLQGEVRRIELCLTNLGERPLCHLRLASNWPGFFSLGFDEFASDTLSTAVYPTVICDGSINSKSQQVGQNPL
ncbi:unnamed protein product [Protopolystoma xenopodis]|uniref:TPPC8 second Ig-like domain-containing protein n=1 Tax=Protopolystoma xenopodis TaxID=117903 RepID=A0A448X9H0_9PLAT|nr:unnamed protein product [Protopolystoma xenopodis]